MIMLKQGVVSPTVGAVQSMLAQLGFSPKGVDNDFGPDTEKSVIRFQESRGLLADGIVGPVTMEELEEAMVTLHRELASPGPDSADGEEGRLPFERVPADPEGEGYGHLYLRTDAAEAYTKVLEKVHSLGGVLTSSGGKRDLSAMLNANRSATSLHYCGLALDLYIWSAMSKEQEKDSYVVRLVDPEERQLEVWMRGDPSQVPETKVSDVLQYQDPEFKKMTSVTGPYANLTTIFDEFGFKPIPYRRRFYENGAPLAAEWWHFQYEKALVPTQSTFGGELLKVYSLARLEKSPVWRYRDRRFKINWS